ncbi:MAG: hypothetical protein HC910_01195 [Spirulinaceae cyanobacterium SM2_1_0]|nr:hypothetical protein [Spirulinaceae cyanobacterium SM2_1_0]
MTTSAAARPQAVTWYRIYAIFVAVFYILILLLGIGLLAFDPSTLGITAEDALEMRINAIAASWSACRLASSLASPHFYPLGLGPGSMALSRSASA